MLSGTVYTNVGSVDAMAVRPTPTHVGGGFYDCWYEVNDIIPMLCLAPFDASISIQVSGADAGWDYLHCDPSTMTTQFVAANGQTILGPYYPMHPVGFQNHQEFADIFSYVLPLPVPSALVGASFTAQWVMSDPNGRIRFSNAVKLTAQ
jgi:hypothetical protein